MFSSHTSTNEPAPTSEPTRPHLHKEYEDPHFHDEDLDVPEDDGLPKHGAAGAARKGPPKMPPPKRRFDY